MSICFNVHLLERQKTEMRHKLFSGEWSVETYYQAMHRRPRPYGFCPNCEAHHDLPYEEDASAPQRP